MVLNPTDYTTWTDFADHPIFGEAKSDINDWSLDPSRYCEGKYYGQFIPEWYVHVDPAPPVDEQRELAHRDIANLASVCAYTEQVFGHLKYELVILDDFTVYVWVRHSRFSIDVYPNNYPCETAIIKMLIDSPGVESEHDCQTVMDVVTTLRRLIGT